jgi:hypothetical protein
MIMAETTGIRLVTRWIRPVEAFGPGLIVTVADPAGNYVQLVQLVTGR